MFLKTSNTCNRWKCVCVCFIKRFPFAIYKIGDAWRNGKGSFWKFMGVSRRFMRILGVSLELVTGATIRRLNEKLPLLAAVNAFNIYIYIRLVPFCYLRETSRSGVRYGLSQWKHERGELLRRSYGFGWWGGFKGEGDERDRERER